MSETDSFHTASSSNEDGGENPPDDTTKKRKLPEEAENSQTKKLKKSAYFEFRQNLIDELKCAVCSEIFVDAVTLNCSHSFCRFCIMKWLKERSTCPICRQEILTQNNTLVLDKCVDKLMEFSSDETRERRTRIVENRHREELTLENSNPANPSEEFPNITSFVEITNIVLDYITDDSEEMSDDLGQCIIT